MNKLTLVFIHTLPVDFVSSDRNSVQIINNIAENLFIVFRFLIITVETRQDGVCITAKWHICYCKISYIALQLRVNFTVLL